MKLTIELTEAEVKGLKAYLKDLDGGKIGKEEIRQHIQGIVTGVINSPSENSSFYINENR